MRKGVILFIALIVCIEAAAKGKDSGYSRITFGTEWSYSATFFSGHHNYFIAPEGFRVDDRNYSFRYFTDGEICLHAGYDISSRWNVGIYVGYTGIGDFHAGVPISFRATRYFGDNPVGDRWLAFLDVGSGISVKKSPQEIIYAKAGGGYRISLSRLTKLDFIASLRFIHTHPDVMFYDEIIDKQWVSRNSGCILSASFGMGLTF